MWASNRKRAENLNKLMQISEMCKSLNNFSILVGTGFANDGEAYQANFNRLDQCLHTFWNDLTLQNRSRIGLKIFEQLFTIGPKKVSKSIQNWSQNRSKIDPKSVPKSIQNRSQNRSKIDQFWVSLGHRKSSTLGDRKSEDLSSGCQGFGNLS